ncbi:unannotated protein [freshwater metagenome]|uniref:Unannotated protein n=1 Tax=freshwater metagenome TaxID=449393 RepID=A0A6J7DNX1_9ZZZZ
MLPSMRNRTRMWSFIGSTCTSDARSRRPWAIIRFAIWTTGASSSSLCCDAASRAWVESLASKALLRASISASARYIRSSVLEMSCSIATLNTTVPVNFAATAARAVWHGSAIATWAPFASAVSGRHFSRRQVRSSRSETASSLGVVWRRSSISRPWKPAQTLTMLERLAPRRSVLKSRAINSDSDCGSAPFAMARSAGDTASAATRA